MKVLKIHNATRDLTVNEVNCIYVLALNRILEETPTLLKSDNTGFYFILTEIYNVNPGFYEYVIDMIAVNHDVIVTVMDLS